MSLYYFDHAASAPRREEVAAAMAPYQRGVIGNPSGTHRAARLARRAIEEAREEVAAFVGVPARGVIFTAGGTESCALALGGVIHRRRMSGEPVEIVVSAVEHHAILENAERLAEDYDNVAVRVVGVDADGVLDMDALNSALSPATALVSVMTANNETGVIQPLHAVCDAVRRVAPHAIIHTDAVAAAPWLDLTEVASGVDLLSLCAHKIGGPVNAGALVQRGRISLDAMVPGGGQEQGLRGGTVDVAAAVGLAAAVRLAREERDANVRYVTSLQSRLSAGLSALPDVDITAPGARKLPGHVHVTVGAVASDELLFLLDQEGVCASAASSCSSGAAVASHVLAAMGVSADRARGALRFTMGAENTAEEVDFLVTAVERAISQLRTRL